MNFFGLKKVYFVFALIIILASFPINLNTKAVSDAYNISNYNVNIDILSDGSANVREDITFSFDDTFNGVFLNIDNSGSNGIENMRLSVLHGNTEIPVINSSSHQPETYTLTKDRTINTYKVYEPSSFEDKTFIFRYRLLNVITNYKDVAEFDRLVIAKNWQTDISNVDITINLPNGAKKSDIRVYGHGPLTGSSKILSGNKVVFSDTDVPAYTFIEAIVLFPPSLTPGSVNKSSTNRLPTVLKREKALAAQANLGRENARQQIANEQKLAAAQAEADRLQAIQDQKMQTIGFIMLGFIFVIWIILFIYIYIKYDKEVRPEFTGQYYRELPGKYSPAETTLVMGNGLAGKDIMATLLDLTRRNHIKIEKVEIEKKGIFKTKKIDDYKFIRLDNDTDVLASHEKHLIQWLINSVGDGIYFSIEDLKEYTKSRGNAIEFTNSFNEWKEHVGTDFKKLNILDDSIATGKFLGTAIGIVVIIIGVIYFFLSLIVGAVALGLMGFIMITYSASFKRRTKYGSDQHSKWHAFKRFLEDFSQMKDASINSLVVWEHYLVYAVSLGVAQNVIDHMPELVNVSELDNTNMLSGVLLWQLGGFNAFNNAFNSSMNAVDSAVVSSQSVATSSNSSGFGGGGGFSGGGGFGGGGGGGGGAF